MSQLTPETLQMWLEWAGARLIALPSGGLRPQDTKVIWPEYSLDAWQVLDFRKRLTLRAIAPSAAEISLVDEVLALPIILSDIWQRRILHYRAAVDPISGRYKYPWKEIAAKLETSPHKVKALHSKGLIGVCNRTPQRKLHELEQRLDQVAIFT